MNFTAPAPLSLPSLLLNLGLGIILSILVAWYYVRFGQSLSNRAQFAPIIPLLTLITVLVISVVKSSLALSLGLVGALSIVRFRTAIKDPEELIFLFLAIAIGLGLGADQRIPSLAAVTFIMVYLMLRTRLSLGRGSTHSLYMNIDVPSEGPGGDLLEKINQLLLDKVPRLDLRRLDDQGGRIQITYYLYIRDQDILVEIINQLKQALPESSISIVEQNNMLGG